MVRSAPVNFATVSIDGGFWRERLETVAGRTLPAIHRQFEAQGVLEALAAASPPLPLRIPADENGITPQMFWDADVGRWLEAASYTLAFRRDPILEGQINALSELLAKAQDEDGYLNTWFIAREPDKRWSNLRDHRELYAAGHLIEAAVAHFQATGEMTLIRIALKLVDHIAAMFGRGEDQRRGYCGYPEIELALARLYNVTKDDKHLELASYFIDERGQHPHYFDLEAVARGDENSDFVGRTYEYTQSHRRVRSQDKAVGHATRGLTLYAAMACLAADRGDASLKRATETLWSDVTQRHLYITGGIGGADRTFGPPYDLPNATAHAETSAAVALAIWAKRMLAVELDGKYGDAMELALYNGALGALSQDGERFFRTNPLSDDGGHQRWAWDRCPEAATDIARLVAAVGGYFYSVSEDGLAIHLYGDSSATLSVGGRAVALKAKTVYPWSGKVELTVDPEAALEFTLRARIPAFAEGAKARINGAGIDVAGNIVSGYLEIRRTWNPGDVVELDLPMPITRLRAHPSVTADLGRVAIRRGPLIYCFEAADNPGTPLSRLRLKQDGKLTETFHGDLLRGIVTIGAEGIEVVDDGALYDSGPPAGKPATWTAIPFYLRANREGGAMLVWVPQD
jgi:DUF1680 family protein